jgi:shikimate dehydrogenase
VGQWPRVGTGLAVIGHPISHSVSPQMHNAALAALALREPRFRDWRYHAFDIEPARLGEALAALHERGFKGVNLTVPHKVVAMGIVTSVDSGAGDAGAVNTLAAEEDGWRGFNTDGYGLRAGIQADLGVSLHGTPVILLGAGGAARAAAVACLHAGCASLKIVNRNPANLAALIAHVRPLAEGREVAGWTPGGAQVPVAPGSILINATSLGLKAGDPAPVDLAQWAGVAAVYDMIYNPPVTALLAQAAGIPGIRAANGLGMLVHQGAKALEIWTGTLASELAPVMRAAAAKALGS